MQRCVGEVRGEVDVDIVGTGLWRGVGDGGEEGKDAVVEAKGEGAMCDAVGAEVKLVLWCKEKIMETENEAI